MEKKNILFAPLNPTSWNGMLYVAEKISKYTEIFFVVADNSFDDKYVRQVRKKGFKLLEVKYPTESTFPTPPPNVLLGKISNLLAWIKDNNKQLLKLIRYVDKFYIKIFEFSKQVSCHNQKIKWNKKYAKDILKKNAIDCVAFYCDRTGDFQLSLIESCNRMKIKSVVLPIAHKAGVEDLLSIRKNKKELLCHKKKLRLQFPMQYKYD
ncbi:hypothetical protein LCGC14_3084750, partial [marine sediment metagenome]